MTRPKRVLDVPGGRIRPGLRPAGPDAAAGRAHEGRRLDTRRPGRAAQPHEREPHLAAHGHLPGAPRPVDELLLRPGDADGRLHGAGLVRPGASRVRALQGGRLVDGARHREGEADEAPPPGPRRLRRHEDPPGGPPGGRRRPAGDLLARDQPLGVPDGPRGRAPGAPATSSTWPRRTTPSTCWRPTSPRCSATSRRATRPWGGSSTSTIPPRRSSSSRRTTG